MQFSELYQGHSKVVRFQHSFPGEIAFFDGAFGIRSHSGRTPLRLPCDFALHKPRRYFRIHTWGASQDALCAGRCLPNTLFPIGVEPEVSAPSPMSTAGAGSRGIAAAKETCSAPIRINFSCQANFPANFPAPT